MSGRTQIGKIEAYLCVSQESSNCGYPTQDVQTGLTKERKKEKEKEKEKDQNCSVAMWAVVPYLRIKAFVYYEHYCSCYQKPYFPGGSIWRWWALVFWGVKIKGLAVDINKQKETCVREKAVTRCPGPGQLDVWRTLVLQILPRFKIEFLKKWRAAHVTYWERFSCCGKSLAGSQSVSSDD